MVSKSAKRHIRNGVYYMLSQSGLLGILLKVSAQRRKDHPCVILTYHRFVDDATVYLDKGPVMHHQVDHFEKELLYLKRKFAILSMDEVIDRMKTGIGFQRPSVAITFDDGYRDNYTLAYPVLKRHCVPATIYLTTGLIGTSERTWPDRIELALLETTKNRISHPGLLGGKVLGIANKAEKERTCLEIGQALKIVPDEQRREILKELLESVRVNGKQEEAPRMMLNWEEVKEMAANGITFGSHSHTHPILSRMPVEQAKGEIYKSKIILEENLGAKAKHFAFPNGGRADFSEELREYCREIGFESVASLIHGINVASEGNGFSLKRIGALSPLWMMSGVIVKMLWRNNHV